MAGQRQDLIDYEKLVRDYNDSLNNVLRGFRPAYDFLELWVPDANPASSVANLADSAASHGHKELSLYFSANILKEIDLEAVSRALKPFGTVEQEAAEGGKVIHLNRSSAKGKTMEEINPMYKDKILELYGDLQHQGSILEDGDNLLIRSTKEGISLFGAINTQNHAIHRARFSGTNKTAEAGVLEGLCRVIEGLPIQEADEHGIIKLEYELRGRAKEKRGVKGIVNLFNYPPLFDLPKALLRDLYETYVKKTKYKASDNFFHPAVSQKWKAVPEAEKVAAINKVFEHLLKKEGSPYVGLPLELRVMGIELHHKVNAAIQGEISPGTRAKLYMDLETELRRELDPVMEVFSQNVKDHNAIRRMS